MWAHCYSNTAHVFHPAPGAAALVLNVTLVRTSAVLLRVGTGNCATIALPYPPSPGPPHFPSPWLVGSSVVVQREWAAISARCAQQPAGRVGHGEPGAAHTHISQTFYSHMHAFHPHVHKRTYTHMHTQSKEHVHTCTHMNTHTSAHPRTHTRYTHMRTPHTHIAHARTHTTHTRTHARSHVRTHGVPPPLPPPPCFLPTHRTRMSCTGHCPGHPLLIPLGWTRRA
jgi:hypothetical protein